METKTMMIASKFTQAILQSILVLLMSTFCASCSNDDDDNSEDPGGIVAQTTPLLESIGVKYPIKSINPNSWSYSTFNYSGGRLVSGNDMEDEIGNFTITSNPLNISASYEEQYGSSNTSYSMLRVNEQGFLTYGKWQNIETEGTTTETFEATIKAEYDNNGYITHLAVEYIDYETTEVQKAMEERHYTWSNGNLVKIEEKETEEGEETETYITTFTYDSNANKNLNSGIFFGTDCDNVLIYSGLLGRPSKNIPISTSEYEEGNATPYSRNITTTYDNLGRIISSNVSTEGSSQVTYGY